MSTFSGSTVQSCIKLRDELYSILKCIYCNKILTSARTLNCSHHVCASCADDQLSNEGSCIQCHCTYFTKDITNNVSINNIIEVFHNLSSTIESAANILNIKTSPINNNSKEEQESESELESESNNEEEEEEELNCNNKSRKRKSCFNTNENQEIDLPKAKKRKLNNYNILIPKEICMTGFDDPTHKEFESYANKFNIILNKKWKVQQTEMLIAQSNEFNEPKLSYKVLASILCAVPIVKQSYLKDSYNAGEILDHNNYICNYKRVCNNNNNGIFKGLNILFATTNMPTHKLKQLLSLGKAKIMETQEEVNCKDKNMFDKRIMICRHDTDCEQAKMLSETYNCRIISESWVIKCIYDNDVNKNNDINKKIVNYYEMEPITNRAEFGEFDLTKMDDSDSDLSDSDSDQD